MDSLITFMVIIGIVFGFITGAIAESKHRSFLGWFIVGFLLSLVGVLIAVVMPKNAKKCPKCGEFSKFGTTKCEICGYEFIPEAQLKTE